MSLPMRTLKLTLAYDGTNYAGWQRQENATTVQQIVEEALAPLMPEPGAPPTVAGAGRTDAGVHALGQVASVHVPITLPAVAVQRALNSRLPADIRVVGAVDAKPGFHARFHAAGKSYRYRIAATPVLSPFDRWFVWHAPWVRDLEAMRRAAAAFVGRHDFASFQARGASVRETVRTIHRLEIREAAGDVVIDIDGDGFLRHMARAIVGTLSEVASGHRAVETMAAVITAANRAAAGPTAPAAGLTLMSVRY
jgi:tRNA pseudouridine38-40 synthase